MPSAVQSFKSKRRARRKQRGPLSLTWQTLVYLTLLSLGATYMKFGAAEETQIEVQKHGRALLEETSQSFPNGNSKYCYTADTWNNATLATKDKAAGGRRLLSGGGVYPKDAFGLPDTKATNGAMIILHIIGMLYMFIGLAIVCDEFFEPSLDAICEALSLSEDVAGATFMAAGSSAPEFFTSVMGVFAAENSDVGVGAIVGSAVFNVLIIIGLCSIVAPNVKLSWWPLTRDCICYCLSIVALVIFIVVNSGSKREIVLYEGIICICLYICYIILMKFNQPLREYFTAKAEKGLAAPHSRFEATVESACFQIFIMIIIVGNLVVIGIDFATPPTDTAGAPMSTLDILNMVFAGIFICEMILKIGIYGFYRYWSISDNAFDGVLVGLIIFELILKAATPSASGNSDGGSDFSSLRALRMLRITRIFRVARAGRIITGVNKIKKTAVGPESDETGDAEPKDIEMAGKGEGNALVADKNEKDEGGEGGDDDDDDDDSPFWPLEIPDSIGSKIYWAFTLPLGLIFYVTIPDCRREMWKKYFFLTFTMSIVMIAAMSYMMVWWAEVFGNTLSIPPAITGLTLLAAGTSVPDTIASVSVAKKGQGDMAVSNSLGSNIFDILICLGFPWLINSARGINTEIKSESLVISVMILFVTVGIVVLCIHFSDFYLRKKVGYFLLFVYFLFCGQALLTEFLPNLFGLCIY